MTELFKDLGEFFAGALVVIAPLTLKYVRKKIDASKFTQKKLDIASMVSDRLANLRATHNIDRLGIIEFSNGDKSVSGFPFLFVTMTFEKCSSNISGISHLMNKVPASWYIDFNKHFSNNSSSYGSFYDNGLCKIGEEESMSNETAKILKGLGIKNMWIFKIGHNISLGLLYIAFIDEARDFSPTDISSIQGDCSYISILFNQRPQ